MMHAGSAPCDWTVFFAPPVGFIVSVDPHAILGIPEDTPQADIAARLPHADARLGPNDAEYAAVLILSDPARRIAWHFLRPPSKRPGARLFARAHRDARARRAMAAHLLDQAVRRELSGPRGEALDELWEEVHREFDALVASDGLEPELRLLAERFAMADPSALARTVRRDMEGFLPNLHALLFAVLKDPERKAFHWSKVPDEATGTPLVGACLEYGKRGRRTPAQTALHQGRAAASSPASARPPQPPLGAKDPDVEHIHHVAERLSEQTADLPLPLRSPRATAFSPWLFSRHDLGRKLVAATGILLLGIGLGRMSVDAWNGHRRSTAYKELCEAAAANDKAAAGAAAERFLALTPPDVFDYRTLDVLEVRSDALLREISRAALTDRRADIERLLAESTALEERAKNEEETWRAIAEAQ